MERGRGRAAGRGRGRGGGRGRSRGDYGGRRGGRGGPTHLTDLAYDEAVQSLKENKISNLQKILTSYPQLLRLVKKNTSIFMEAFRLGNMEAINMLLEHKDVDLNLETHKRTLLDFAAKENNEELVWRFLSKNAKGKPFLSSMEGGHAKLAEQLMNRLYNSPEEAAQDHRGDYTLPVHLAGSVECLKLVLPHSDVNAVSYMYGTPLQAAIALKHFEVAEYLVDHVPEVEFEPESWIYSIVGTSPLHLALVSGHRPLVEKLLNSGKCQKTLDSTIGCPTPEEYLNLFDNCQTKDRSDIQKGISPKPAQKVTFVPPKVSKEAYLNSIFKILNVPEADREISYEDPAKSENKVPVVQTDSIYNYPSLEECPSSLLRTFLTDRKIEFDPNTLHNELVEKVKTLKINIENTTPEAQKDESEDIIVDTEAIKAIPDIIPEKELKGYFERDGRQHFMKLEITNQKGSNAYLDLKTPGLFSIHRSHFFNQNQLYQSKIVMLMGTPTLMSTTHLTEGLAFRLVSGQVRNAFDSKVVVEKVEPGVELFYGELHFQEEDSFGDDFGGRIIVNNGKTFVFFASMYSEHLEKMSGEYGVDESVDPDTFDEAESHRLRFPVPRLPHTFFVGELKVKAGASDVKEGAVLEGVWWETNLDKYSEAEVLDEKNFTIKGKWRFVSPFNAEEDGPTNPGGPQVHVAEDVPEDYEDN